MSVPYASATTGTKAREEVSKVPSRFACEPIGFMDDFEKHEVLRAFKHSGRQVQLRALQQGHVVVNSTVRDWIKGQTTAIEGDILSFEAVFLPCMLTRDGRPLIKRAGELLPRPDEPKVVSLHASAGAA
jgi:hypothetical protein